MGPAADLHHPPGGIGEKAVVGNIGVRLQITTIIFQESFRSSAFPCRRVIVDNSRVITISHIGPYSTLSSVWQLAIQDLDRRIVGADYFRCKNEILQAPIQRS
jgi:hypothetical protein